MRLKEKNTNRLNQFKAAQNDARLRMTEKHEGIFRKQQIAQSNVQLTRGILSEYRSLKKEEANLRKNEIQSNLEIEKKRAFEDKYNLLTRQSVKSGNISQIREKQ
jgi:hypothetical protein